MASYGSAESRPSSRKERFYITDEMPVEMYTKGNHRIYLDNFSRTAPKFEVKALVTNRIATVTNDTTNGLLSTIEGNSKKQIPEDTIIYFDNDFIYWLNQQGIETDSLFAIDNNCDDDFEANSGIQQISQEILKKVAMEVETQKSSRDDSKEK